MTIETGGIHALFLLPNSILFIIHVLTCHEYSCIIRYVMFFIYYFIPFFLLSYPVIQLSTSLTSFFHGTSNPPLAEIMY